MKLWENSRSYSFGRIFTDACTRSLYWHFQVCGKENIPADGAVILSPNHTNTLMDALVMLRLQKGPIAFGARADLFQKGPRVARALHWLKIVPLARARDGAEALKQSQEIIDEIVDCLGHKVPFCLFPEGTHRPKRSLLPLKKGIFRIAAQAAQNLDVPVYVVPVGIEHESYYKAGRDIRVSFGEPIRITPDASSADFLAELTRRMWGLITWFPDDENYPPAVAAWEKGRHKSQLWRYLLLPVWGVSALMSLPIWLPSEMLVARLKDKAWSNTVRYVFRLLLLPPLVLAAGICAFVWLPWYGALLTVFCTLLSPMLFYRLLPDRS